MRDYHINSSVRNSVATSGVLILQTQRCPSAGVVSCDQPGDWLSGSPVGLTPLAPIALLESKPTAAPLVDTIDNYQHSESRQMTLHYRGVAHILFELLNQSNRNVAPWLPNPPHKIDLLGT